MVSCTNFHDHGTQYREINLYFQICINITGVLKFLDGTVCIYIFFLGGGGGRGQFSLNICAFRQNDSQGF